MAIQEDSLNIAFIIITIAICIIAILFAFNDWLQSRTEREMGEDHFTEKFAREMAEADAEFGAATALARINRREAWLQQDGNAGAQSGTPIALDVELGLDAPETGVQVNDESSHAELESIPLITSGLKGF